MANCRSRTLENAPDSQADGHLRKVIQMIEGGRPCLDLVQQLYAVENALAGARTTLIKDHLDNCLDNVVGPMTAEQRREIEEFKAIAKYL
nr:metal-sensing transcriptional repressor [Rhodovibrio sodomensis]